MLGSLGGLWCLTKTVAQLDLEITELFKAHVGKVPESLEGR